MKKATLTTLTPVHIGNGVTYNEDIDYIRNNDTIYFVDPEKVFSIIGTENIDMWVRSIENKKATLLKLLAERNKSIKPNDISTRSCKIKTGIGNIKQLMEQYYTSVYGPCIPGSSIKGAIRTCLLDFITNKADLNNITVETLKDQKNKWKDNNIETRFWGANANEKTTRFLKVGDANFNKIETEIHQTEAINASKDGTWDINDGLKMLLEVIPANSESVMKLKLDNTLLERNLEKEPQKWEGDKMFFLEGSIENIAKRVNNSTVDSLELEIDNFSRIDLCEEGENMIDEYKKILIIAKNCSPNELILRVGAGSGYSFTTGRWIEKLECFEKDENAFIKLRKFIQKKEYHEELWPRTRKLTSNGIPLGFVKITIQ